MTLNETASAKAALFTIPPTLVRRSENVLATYGQESISKLINRATALIMRQLGNYQVTASAGKLTAFQDIHGNRHVLIEEDAWPQKGHPIQPLVKISLNNVKPQNVTCDKPFALVKNTEVEVQVRIHLSEHESARITIAGDSR